MNDGSLTIEQEEQATPEPEYFRLITRSEVTDNPTIAVSWCLTPAGKQALLDKGADPNQTFVFVSVYHPNAQETDRYLFPINSGMGFVQFRAAGKNTLHAVIIWPLDQASKDGVKRLKNNFFTKESSRCFDYQMYDFSENFRLDLVHNLANSVGHSEIDMMVERKFFAKKPSEWLNNWVNLFTNGEVRDQCHFRKRALFAFTIQPILVLLLLLISGLIIYGSWIGLLLCGMRGLPSLKSIWEDAELPWRHLDGSVFLTNQERKLRPFSLWPWIPAFPLANFAHLEVLNHLTEKGEPVFPHLYHLSWHTNLTIALGTVISLSLIGAVIDLIKLGLSNERKRPVTLPVKSVREEALDSLVCNGQRPLSYGNLPSSKRTFALLFQATKARVCRPYARG